MLANIFALRYGLHFCIFLLLNENGPDTFLSGTVEEMTTDYRSWKISNQLPNFKFPDRSDPDKLPFTLPRLAILRVTEVHTGNKLYLGKRVVVPFFEMPKYQLGFGGISVHHICFTPPLKKGDELLLWANVKRNYLVPALK
ncbi:hypothetical protein KIH39_16045 [Telmatocola sphagniphila]|uniref:Uncharacterized protein n=1 Tax=Telmatocola sphagniphila TaxID=1123043 RepID=A0A8E6B1M0_9BACT|nr:hypothetical protein [Telmatocola sphagniphila]QVL30360.1 hypothetical protein KIH39_16045 [Telmatocola sphagniphila]